MSTVVLDPLARLLAAPEGRYEWADGNLIEMPPASPEHGRRSLFLATILSAYAEHHDLGVVYPDGLILRLDATIRIPDVAFVRGSNLERIKPTHLEGGADLVVEIVSP